MLCALIMAGGKGTRFWPQSTEAKPKQFLNLVGTKTMLQMTYDRINKLVDSNHIFIATNKNYYNLVKEQIPNINDNNIILEPCSKNTAPCILLSSLYIKNMYNNSNVICISSDNIIENEDSFINDVVTANNFINNNQQAIVTIGIKPTRPETGFGYIKCNYSNEPVLKVEKFVEKPNYELASEYLNSGNYLWNAGMFIFNIDSMLQELKENIPNEYDLLEKLPSIKDNKYFEIISENYNKCNKISIDYAVMEKSKNVYTIPADFGWDDVGTWKSLERYINKDYNKNLLKGDIETINSHQNIVYANGKKIILLDIDDLLCVDSDDALIITKKDNIDKIHKLKDELEVII